VNRKEPDTSRNLTAKKEDTNVTNSNSTTTAQFDRALSIIQHDLVIIDPNPSDVKAAREAIAGVSVDKEALQSVELNPFKLTSNA